MFHSLIKAIIVLLLLILSQSVKSVASTAVISKKIFDIFRIKIHSDHQDFPSLRGKTIKQ